MCRNRFIKMANACFSLLFLPKNIEKPFKRNTSIVDTTHHECRKHEQAVTGLSLELIQYDSKTQKAGFCAPSQIVIVSMQETSVLFKAHSFVCKGSFTENILLHLQDPTSHFGRFSVCQTHLCSRFLICVPLTHSSVKTVFRRQM